mgnify:CR=1 FL=1
MVHTVSDPALTFTMSARILSSNARHVGRLHPGLRGLADAFLARSLTCGIPLAITQSDRSDAFQRGLFAKGRTLPGPHAGEPGYPTLGITITNAPSAASSAHGRGGAFDVAVLIDGRLVGPRPGPGNDSYDRDLKIDGRSVWMTLKEIAGSIGLVAGATFPPIEADGLGWDLGHFELREWRHLPFPLEYALA